MSILDVTQLTHGFGEKNLYRNASFALNRGEHMGITGQNGVGKSTLIDILTGRIVADAGRVRWQGGISLGFLGQYAQIDRNQTIHAFLRTAFAELFALEAKLNELYARLRGDEADLQRAAAWQDRLEDAGFYEVDTRIRRVMTGLGLDALGEDRPLSELSGGQRAKVILAKLLLQQPDVLLLDEPTNFLDREHIDWLAGYLTAFPGAYMLVSHDFAFLDRVTTCILDIEFGTIRKYHGRYADFVAQKTQQRADYLRQYEAQQREIERIETYIAKNKARAATAKMARGRQKQLDRLERLEKPAFTGRPHIRFAETPPCTEAALEVRNLSVGYGHPLLPPIGFALRGGEKLAITGFNGIGKSTLLRTLMGEIPALGGRFAFSDGARLAYYSQELTWEDGERTAVQTVGGRFPQLAEKQVRAQLARCGVKAENARQPLRTLSGGEQAKVKLTMLTLTPCNVLILDEPTNHLDAVTREELQEALQAYQGAVILVSHDAAFHRRVVNRTIELGR